MATRDLDVKRLRRTLEPETKLWNDDALETIWEEVEGVGQHTLFAMRNVLFFPHATSVQVATIPKFAQPGSTVVVEAATGSGKTIAFLVPMLERIVQGCDRGVELIGRPLLSRCICGIVLSPSGVLAQQTFVVGRSLACRFPYNIRFELCDSSVETMERTAHHLKSAARGGGTVLVTTPKDLCALIEAFEKLDAEEKAEREQAETEAGVKRSRNGDVKAENPYSSQSVYFGGLPVPEKGEKDDSVVTSSSMPFMIVIDEADVVLRSSSSTDHTLEFLKKVRTPNGEVASSGIGRVKAVDVGLFGATVSSASEASIKFLSDVGVKGSQVHRISTGSNEQFISLLRNCVVAVEPDKILEGLVHLVNAHPTKKHFVFCNNPAMLKFIKALFEELLKPTKPLLHIPSIYALHEGLTDQQKMSQYNAFLRHSAAKNGVASGTGGDRSGPADGDAVGAVNRSKKKFKHKNNESLSHLMRSVDPSKRVKEAIVGQRGAILLCTDFAAFGLDVRDVDYVYHIDVPLSAEAYTHRIGRVARMGMRGTSVLLLPSSREKSDIFVAISQSEPKIEQMKLPPSAAPLASTLRGIINSDAANPTAKDTHTGVHHYAVTAVKAMTESGAYAADDLNALDLLMLDFPTAIAQ